MIFALVSMVLIAFVGLSVDGGFAYLTQREEQTAADAASLDASTLLNGTQPVPAAVFAMGRRIAQTNGYATAPAPCSTATSGGQTVYVYVDSGCNGGAPARFTSRVVVKVPPDPGTPATSGNCAVNASKPAYSCVQVDVDYVMPTTLEHIFGFPTVLIHASSVTYNGHALPAPPSGGTPLYTPTVSCTGSYDRGGFDLGTNTPGATWNGNAAQPHWVTPNATQASPGGPWVWTVIYGDEWPLDAYTLTIYSGATAGSGHFFSQGVWIDQASTTLPANNQPGPDTTRTTPPLAAQDVGSHPAGAAPGTFYNKISTETTGYYGVSDWVAQFADGTTMEVNGNWSWGGTTSTIGAGPNWPDTITFTMPAGLVPAGSTPGFSAFMQDGDRCGDTALFETESPPSPPPPPPGPIVLDS